VPETLVEAGPLVEINYLNSDCQFMTRLALTLLVSVALAGITCAGDERPSGIDFDGFDKKVRPQDDLFGHVNGRWLLATEIPADKSNYGAFTALDDAAREHVRAIIAESARQPADESGRKVGDFYQSYMNEELINKMGIDPLRAELAAIDALASTDDLVAYFGRTAQLGIASPAGFMIGVDDKEQAILLTVALAIGAVAGLAAINILGVVFGKTIQNILSLAKVLGLGAIVYVGFNYQGPSDAWNPDPSPFGGTSQFAVPLILILYAYG
jgi:hypothetical protein